LEINRLKNVTGSSTWYIKIIQKSKQSVNVICHSLELSLELIDVLWPRPLSSRCSRSRNFDHSVVALRCHVDMTLGRFPDSSWRRRPGRPRNRWLDQLRGDSNSSPADLWRRASSRGHSGVTLRSSPTTR